jgi:plasmid stabilization system protein ParE
MKVRLTALAEQDIEAPVRRVQDDDEAAAVRLRRAIARAAAGLAVVARQPQLALRHAAGTRLDAATHDLEATDRHLGHTPSDWAKREHFAYRRATSHSQRITHN